MISKAIVSPEAYIKAAVLAQAVNKTILERLAWVTLKPKIIVALGCRTGEMAMLLKQHYPLATVTGLDSSESMLAYAKKRNKEITWQLLTDLPLPLSTCSVDLIYANLWVLTQFELNLFLQECRRLLRSDGLILLTALGPDTLKSCQEQLKPIPLFDLHNVGDALLSQGFLEPVVDVDYFTLTYKSREAAFHELRQSQIITGECSSAFSLPITPDGKWPVSYEVVYAQAFAPGALTVSASTEKEIHIPVSYLRGRLGE